jgi:hypothetical protein
MDYLRTTCGPIEYRAVGSKARFSLIGAAYRSRYGRCNGVFWPPEVVSEKIVGSSGQIPANCDRVSSPAPKEP